MLHVFSFLIVAVPAVLAAIPLNAFIRHYEPLQYNTSDVHIKHQRAKRSITDPFVHINFHAHGRQFNLRLQHDRSAFSDNLIVDTPSGLLEDFDLSHLYSGSLWGEDGTHAFGAIRDGIFDGKIITDKGNYYVERAHKYFKPEQASDFHSVIYHEHDVKDPFEKERHEGRPCGVTDEVLQWMENVQSSAVDGSSRENDANTSSSLAPVQPLPSPKTLVETDPKYKYSREAQSKKSNHGHSRSKRAVLRRRACSLYIQTDPLLWEHIQDKESSDPKVREEIASLIGQHVKAVNHIYESEDFSGYRGIKFVVQRITINDTTSCDTEYKRAQNPFCSSNIDVSNFLNLNSQMNHDAFCLAYVFTYRDFTGGTLGLAWVASPQGASGGICEKFKAYTENIGGHHVQTKRSLNTGIITFVNYNNRVPPKVSQLTLAHEIGHNFGSPHDWPKDCRPGGQEGNFIMFASATSGDRPNNSKFSECSRRNITAVLDAVIHNKGGKDNCFQEEDGPFCGNRIVEAGEECDCGYNREECTEACCYPREITEEDRRRNESARPCARRYGTECSPSEGPCCNNNCYHERSFRNCRLDSDCNYEATCSGHSARCPPSRPKTNGTECNQHTQVCLSGECIGSICLKYGLEECSLTRSEGVTPEQLCEVACQEPGRPLTCKSTFQQTEMFGRVNITGIKLRPGSPCDNFQGYCDVFQKCRAVDAEGPLARLKNLLFNQRTLMTIRQWVTEYWWAVLLMGVGFVLIMGCFIKCCAVHTPSSNPKKPPALRITDTLRHPTQTLRRKRRPPASQNAPPHGGHAPPPYRERADRPNQSRPQRSANNPPPNNPRHSTSPSAPPAPGPLPRGYGEGRGHYNRHKGPTTSPGDPYAAAYPPGGRVGAFELRQQNV